ncbi:MAG TPA: VWA domain-containing protein [Pyrinomonadaceae bacterium]|nr:VWA domain-containing protein [Pyrinomonadaceae bacterium]
MLRSFIPSWGALPCILVLLMLAAPGAREAKAQPKSPVPTATPPTTLDQEIDPEDVISVNTTEVLLPVTVRNSNGLLVNNLELKDFRVYEDGVEQRLSDLSLRKVPVDVVLLVDASSSVAKNLDDFRKAAEGFAMHLNPEDRLSLMQFDDRVLLLQDWTANVAQLRRSLKRIAPGMFTRFHDAMLLASREQLPRADARHAIIVLTDGIDSGRGSTFDAALRAALESQTIIYVVSNTRIERSDKQRHLDELLSGTDSAIRFNHLRIDDLRLGLAALDASERNLEELTSSTGGKLFRPAAFTDLEKIYREVAEELSQQYTVFYSPQDVRRNGRFRRLRVETTNPTHRVSARIGYYAPRK